jgi:RNA polymerase I-associated factor PAF67
MVPGGRRISAVELVTAVACAHQWQTKCLLGEHGQEMYFRHLYATCQPTLEQRVASWDNYQGLFGVILHGNVNMQLPNAWLWDMIDEFIYQFQSFAQYRGKLSQKSPQASKLSQPLISWPAWLPCGGMSVCLFTAPLRPCDLVGLRCELRQGW